MFTDDEPPDLRDDGDPAPETRRAEFEKDARELVRIDPRRLWRKLSLHPRPHPPQALARDRSPILRSTRRAHVVKPRSDSLIDATIALFSFKRPIQ